ncbi:proline-rich protein Hua1p [[Candida] jaroonii]|uniref:Proline-rich protein Hua1p n=1 Tax=[Candida] jaroonii TaxID=467808 RepID=A0ACA9YGI5_9ASCO|nr:proline-rich protein Hua1p [[Candida] jaroonii]
MDEDKPPPTYEEAIGLNSPPYGSTGNSYQAPNTSQNHSRPPIPPPHPPTMPSRPPDQPPRPSENDIYTANLSLPWRYRKGVFCKRCKNTGYKPDGKYCTNCWEQYYLRKNAYNPNPNLHWKYPKSYYCSKCNNTGTKTKNGRSCKDCYERFAPRNGVRVSSSTSYDLFGSTTTTNFFTPGPSSANYSGPIPNQFFNQFPGGPPPGQFQSPPPPPIRVRPGDPRLGGALCGRCRGSGVVHFLLDEDLCPVCSGVGRLFR